MNFDMNPLTQRILDLTLEIIYLQNGEDYIVTKFLSGRVRDRSRYQMSGGRCKTWSPSVEPQPQSLIHDRKNNQKILELTHKIIRLLTGEVPIRCEDVTVYLSMEEWEYVERHKDLYKGVMMEDHQPVITLDKSVSGKCHTPASLPDLGNENKTEEENINNGGKCLKTNKSRKEQVTTRTEHESLAFNERHVTERDLYQHTEHIPIEYPHTDMKEEPTSCDEVNLTNSDSFKPTEHTYTECPPTDIKEEPTSCDEGNLSDTDIYKPTEHAPVYFLGCLGLNAKLLEVTPCESLSESRKPDRRIYHDVDVSPVTMNTDLTHNLMSSSEIGKNLDSDPDLVIRETKCREEEYVSFDGKENFLRQSHYVEHQEGHNEERPFSCSECVERFTDSVSPNKHQRIHMGEKLFKCTDCEKCLSSNFELFIHQKTHTVKNPFTCTECGKCYAQGSSLARHKKTHIGGKTYKCPECDKCYIQATSLARHKMTHTGENTFKCPECGKCFTQASALARHRKAHTGEKPHKCPECGVCFTQAPYLANHKVIHTGEKPYQCPECEKCYTQASSLAKHKVIHTGEKPHICPECGKRFTLASSLAKHKLIHTGEKPHTCTECVKCFTQASSLEKHKMVHTGEKPYKCTECGKCFSQGSNLATHKKVHIREKVYGFIQ